MSLSEFDRRSLLIATGGAALASATPGLAGAPARKAFPKGFLWGASTAGHQIEGNNVNSDLWFLENIQPNTFADRSGDADDSYHRWADDIALMKAIGLNCYRFSIEWARLEPTRGHFSQAEFDHYKRFIEALHKAGIAPMATFIHTAAPRWFAENGGFLNPESSDLFAHYCDKAARELGDGLSHAFTINEPQVNITYRIISAGGDYFKQKDVKELALHAEASRRTGSANFVTLNHPDIMGMTPNLIASHHKGFAAIKAAHGKLPTGVTLNLVDFEPGNEGSPHKEVREKAYGQWMDAVKQSGDFVGVQTYRQIRIPGAGKPLPPLLDMPFVDRADMGEMIKQPVALRNMVEYAHERSGKPVFVTENGLETDDDRRRVWYIPQVLSCLHEAVAKGIPVLGYSHWSLIDNFEWNRGFAPHFGLASVDRTTFKRTLKPSAAVYRQIIRNNAV